MQHLRIRRIFPYTTLFRSAAALSSSGRSTTPPPLSRWLLGALALTGWPVFAPETGAPTKGGLASAVVGAPAPRSEEHTSELQSRPHLVCRLLLEKKNLP